MEQVIWPGRMDVVSERPLIVVDGAHNNDGVEALYEFVKEWPRHDVLVLGEKQGKNMSVMAEKVVPLFGQVIITRGVYMSEDPDIVAAALQERGYTGNIECVDDAHEAVVKGRKYLNQLNGLSQNIEPTMLVSGSLYLVAGVLPDFL